MSLSKLYPTIRPSLLLDFAADAVLDPRITFTRATPATYYDGVTQAVAEQNLVLQSQTFDSAYWAVQGSTKGTDVTTAPDGTSTADSITETAVTGTHQIFPNGAATIVLTTSAVYTWSCYAKPNGRNFASLQLGSYSTSGRYSFAIFDISTGAVTQTGNLGSATYINSAITSAGNGWYRISLTASLNTGTDGYISIGCSNSGTPTKSLFGDPNYLGDGTSGIFIWGAQLEQRSSVTAYTATTTAAITNYIPVLLTAAAGVPRFEHNPVTGASLGLEIEEQRTNLLTYSSELDNAAWTKARSSIIANTIIAPDGTLTGDKVIEDTTASNTHLVQQTPTLASGLSLTASVYAKAAERNWIRLQLNATSGTDGSAYFDLSTGTIGTIGGGSATITPVGNGWYRCTVSGTTTTTNPIFRVNLASGNGGQTYTGDGYSGIYIWGAQLEAGAFPTSYIATVATTQQRNADVATMTGTNFSSWYNVAEGTLYSDFVAAITNGPPLAVGRDAFVDTVSMNVTNLLRFAASSPFLTLGTSVSGANKISATLKSGDFAASNNGASAVTSNALVTAQQTANRLNIGYNYTGGVFLNGTIAKIAYYPARLTNAQLQALTQS
jgi:hypothetical protein